MSSSSRITKATSLARVLALIAGTQKHLSSGSFTLEGTSYTAASIVPLLQSVADAIMAVNAAEAIAKDTVAAKLVVEAKVGPVIQAYSRFVRVTFTSVTQTLADFGLAPKKVPAPRTVEQKAVAKAKAEATRKARGTTSKKQKLAITGNVTGITVTPVTTPAAAEPSTQAASTTPSVPTTGTATK